MMDTATQATLAGRLFAHLDRGTTDYAAAEMHLPTRVYFDADHGARERAAVFATHPLVAAHSSELAAPGDFVTTDLAGTPVLIVRQADGGVQAFINVCRHRGARVVCVERGNERVFSCRYHGWAYNRDGSLRSIPYDDGFCNLDRADYPLVRLPAGERHGLVWVVPSPCSGGDADLDLAAFLGAELDAELAGYRVESFVLHRTETYTQPINWKLIADGFLDAYHLKFLHPKTVSPLFHTNVHLWDSFEPHARLITPRKSIDGVRQRPPEEIDLLRHVIVGYHLMPNTILVVEPAHYEAWTIMPDASDPAISHTTIRFLIPTKPQTDADAALWEKNWTILMGAVQNEDWWAAGTIQASLRPTGVTELVLGRNESSVQHLHRYLAAVIAGETAPSGVPRRRRDLNLVDARDAGLGVAG